MFCANCACELPAVAKFCVRCGATVEPSTSSILARVATPPVGQPVKTTSVRCLKCGAQNPSDYSFCTVCGASLTPVGSPVFVSNTATAFGGAVPSAKNEETASEAQLFPAAEQAKDPLRGVGGWLLLFCVSTTVFGPLACAAEILQNPSPLVVGIDLGLAAFSIYVGVTTWRAQPNALKFVKIYFIVMLVLACLTVMSSLSTNAKEIGQQSSSDNPVVIGFRILFGVAIWWSYFAKSKRVKATFGSNL